MPLIIDKLINRRKQNCWEFKKCGREPGGAKVKDFGVCPAAEEKSFNGVFGGKNSGRACWVVAGTFCKGEIQGSFAQKLTNCENCDFYKKVQKEEGGKAHQLSLLLSYLKMNEDTDKKKYRTVLNNLVDPSVVSEALSDLDKLKKGREKIITAFFTDIASFSVISEKLSAAELAALLNEYLSAMTVILKEEKGTLDKYIGDAIVGMFGAPCELSDAPIYAARTALRMIAKLEELRAKWKSENRYCSEAYEMRCRIGLSTGTAKVGFMGTDTLASYTMMGASVNLAKWLEYACKSYGVEILVSEETKKLIAHEMFLRVVDDVRVKGKTDSVRIYELVGETEKVPLNIREACAIYEKGFASYCRRNWNEAISFFNKSVETRMSPDRVAQYLIERCETRLREEIQTGLTVSEKTTAGNAEPDKSAESTSAAGTVPNCWEFKKCGREPGGVKVSELGICPAAVENRLDGIHRGTNSGRACWAVAGTFCKGEVQGSFAQKFKNCSSCDFYKIVREQEGFKFKMTAILLSLLRDGIRDSEIIS